jgi:adenosylmethionine-8-amino-7-oxononanoate aminotransferase
MTHILHRQISHDYPVAATGRGIFIRDTNGKDYIDASGGAGSNAGYGWNFLEKSF